MKGFEPLRRESRPTAFRVRTLQPLGYISMDRSITMTRRVPAAKLWIFGVSFPTPLYNYNAEGKVRQLFFQKVFKIFFCFAKSRLDKNTKSLYSYKYRAAGEIAVPCTCNPLQQG